MMTKGVERRGRRELRRSVARVSRGVLAICLAASLSPSSRAQIIDRVLAVVAGQPITLSDVRAAITFGLIPAAAAGENDERAALNSLIDRQLQLIEVNRYLPPEPTAAELDTRLMRIRARFDSEAAFEAALVENGLTADLLRARIRDNLRIESYLAQRFGVGAEPTEEEVGRFAKSAEIMRGSAGKPYAEIREEARRRLIEARRNSLIEDWIAGLRRRVDVAVLTR